MNSIWLKHEKYPGYLFSPEGNCFSLRRNKVLKQRIKKNGYVQFYLNQKDINAHRIIAEIFSHKMDHHQEVNHKNGIRHDNRIENLEWVTKGENLKHSFDFLNRPRAHRQGINSNFAKLSEEQIISIREQLSLNKKWGFAAQLARKYNVSPATICLIKSNKTWAHLS